MIVEIHYYGHVVGQIDLPEVTNIEGLNMSARIESKMHKIDVYEAPMMKIPEPEWKDKKMYSKLAEANKRKRNQFDRPRFKFPDNEPVTFEWVKGEYSNKQHEAV